MPLKEAGISKTVINPSINMYISEFMVKMVVEAAAAMVVVQLLLLPLLLLILLLMRLLPVVVMHVLFLAGVGTGKSSRM